MAQRLQLGLSRLNDFGWGTAPQKGQASHCLELLKLRKAWQSILQGLLLNPALQGDVAEREEEEHMGDRK